MFHVASLRLTKSLNELDLEETLFQAVHLYSPESSSDIPLIIRVFVSTTANESNEFRYDSKDLPIFFSSKFTRNQYSIRHANFFIVLGPFNNWLGISFDITLQIEIITNRNFIVFWNWYVYRNWHWNESK